MCKRITFKSLLFVIATCSLSCRTLLFYPEPDKPVFYSSQNNISTSEKSDSLNVLTFNIKKSIKIQLAISEIREFEKTRTIDIFLLQEMDEKGMEEIANALYLNYLYFPVSHDNADKKNIGNAILTTGTITNPKKLVLPHAKWQNQQRRGVTIGEVTIHEKKILVYNIHTETFAMSRKDRMDQIDGITEHAKLQSANYKYVLLGGDFNTVFSKYAQLVVEKFTGNGFDWSTAKVGATASGLLGLVKPTNDYLFTKGLMVTNAFAIKTSRSSDHLPVFASFRF